MNSERKSKSISRPFLILLVLGSVSFCLTIVKSGLIYSYGMGFWGANGHDGIWHIALINQLAKLRLDHPTFAGERIFNYHFGFDLLVAFFHLLTRIPVINLYFQFFPPIFAVLIGLLTYRLILELTRSKSSAFWATFFVYFSGSWGWLISFLRNRSLGGESMFWANQAVSTLINPPYALSLILFLSGDLLFLKYWERPSVSRLLITALILGILIQVKVYAGVIVLGSLFLLSSLSIILNLNKKIEIWQLFFACLGISLIVFLPFNSTSGSLLIFLPFWFPHSMLYAQDRFYWPLLANSRQIYFATKQWLKFLAAELFALFIFIVGNLGTRVIGFVFLLRLWQKKGKFFEFWLWFFLQTLVSLTIPLIFIQKGNPWNTIQFFYYFQFFLAILTGLGFGSWLEQRKHDPRYSNLLKYFGTIFVLLLTVPTTIITLKNDYLPGRPPAKISPQELVALDYLRRQPEGVVLTYPFNADRRDGFSPPKPLYVYETTSYVSAFSQKQTFLEDEMNLEISGYDWRTRRKKEEIFFSTNDQKWANDFLKESKIKYIYLIKGQKMNLKEDNVKAKKIFENGETVIYQIN